MRPKAFAVAVLPGLVLLACQGAQAEELIPPLARIKLDRPRVLLRPRPTPHAICLADLQALPRDAEFDQMLQQLRRQEHAAAQAMVWLLTQDPAPADRAVRRMLAYRYPGKVDTFHMFGHLTEFGLGYDWLYGYPGFDKAARSQVRANVAPLARQAIRAADDHVFHNYIWMSAGGLALWALATAGEDDSCNLLFEQVRRRYNEGLYPAWRYLDGLPSEPMGYWALYVFTPGVWTLLAAQSAFETDLVGAVRVRQGAWLDRHFENLIHSTLPDMRYIPWGDLQGGPNGGVTHEMAGLIDAAAWALGSPHGVQFSRWLAGKRGLQRFYGETALFYMLYTRHLRAESAWPPLSFLAGNRQSGHFIARSGWDDNATIVAFRSTDHFGDHHHYDQGSFLIYRRGLLAVDPPVYRQIRGPQQKTEHHNTLLVGGRPQRPVRGQWFRTVEEFQKNLQAGRRLETGDICFWQDAGPWAAVAGQFAQAYDCDALASCVRQLLFLRPDKVVVVDRLLAVPGKQLPHVEWLLQFPQPPREDQGGLVASNGKSWLRCRAVLPGGAKPVISATPVHTHRVSLAYPATAELALVHLLEVGDGTAAGPPARVAASQAGRSIQLSLDGWRFVFAAEPDYAVSEAGTR
ncbi:MAG: hypothetical protein ACUVUC_01285 [Thermoguttaceae bacterium]